MLTAAKFKSKVLGNEPLKFNFGREHKRPALSQKDTCARARRSPVDIWREHSDPVFFIKDVIYVKS